MSKVSIYNDNWHMSDHRPVAINILALGNVNLNCILTRSMDLNCILKRSMDLLNYEFNPNRRYIKRQLGTYDPGKMRDYLLQNINIIEENTTAAIATCDEEKR